jgi:DNA helicase MCM8
VLVVGDPGMGKSQLLQAVANVAPRGVYVCGNTTSTTGLTVTMVKDGITGDYALEAGALVLGDQGICCIDEFDKMGTEHQVSGARCSWLRARRLWLRAPPSSRRCRWCAQALLEAMEQQRISIAKAGIVSSLSARTSVLAAANPCGGHYNRGKTVVENLRMSPALLSRFDLIFILLDKCVGRVQCRSDAARVLTFVVAACCNRPDDARDRLLSDHVMRVHSERTDAGTKGVLASRSAAAGGSSHGGLGGRAPGTFEQVPHWPVICDAIARLLVPCFTVA